MKTIFNILAFLLLILLSSICPEKPLPEKIPLNEMVVNEIIAKWMGMIESEYFPNQYYFEGKSLIKHFPSGKGEIPCDLDFLHDRNQQKWIEEKLVKCGYKITVILDKNGRDVWIEKQDDETWDIVKLSGYTDDVSFIEAVLELINKENEARKL